MAAFQFTPARGGRPVPEVGADGLVAVSIHARAWRATRSHAEGDAANPFQFTPARGGRRSHAESDAVHHPFQFTPARGGRRPDHRAAPAHRWFQFTPARGGRRWLPTPANPRDFVSIHARAWRATPDIEQRTRAHRVSIHARAWRATAVVGSFQFTPARGGRRMSWRWWRWLIFRFNSRPRVAGDARYNTFPARGFVSIHARAWRATERIITTLRIVIVSIHARAWRATASRLTVGT